MSVNDKHYIGPQPEIEGLKKKALCFEAGPGVHYASTIVAAKCGKCDNFVKTNVEASWNIKSYLCCYYYGCCWWCYQTVKGKDYTMKDAKHTCSCGETLNEYKSCE